jgi:hypothetical protein
MISSRSFQKRSVSATISAAFASRHAKDNVEKSGMMEYWKNGPMINKG